MLLKRENFSSNQNHHISSKMYAADLVLTYQNSRGLQLITIYKKCYFLLILLLVYFVSLTSFIEIPQKL